MTLSLWMLLAFAGWTLLVLLIGVGVYRWSLILTGPRRTLQLSGRHAAWRRRLSPRGPGARQLHREPAGVRLRSS